ncbi:MAG: DUF7402 domain-containing protein [Methylobacter sp.]
MNGSKSLSYLAFLFFLLWMGFANSSILVVSPHPDDDLLIAAGVTYAATQRSEPVTVVYMTNGDNLGLSQGNLRQDEAAAGQINNLGTKENDLIFLGYPDGGLETMYRNYPGQSDHYLAAPSGQTATYAHRGRSLTDYHNYRFGTHANYNGFNLLNDLTDIINNFRPDHIITTAEFDLHPDHYTTYNATHDAILAVTAIDPSYVPVLNKSVVHTTNEDLWPDLFNPLIYFTEPPGLAGTGFSWVNRESLDVRLPMQVPNMTNIKANAINAHASQFGTDGSLGRFIHKDEFFWAVNVAGSNSPPRVNAGVDQTVAQGATVSLNGSASNDPDGTALAYHWRQIAGPSVVLTNATTATPSFTAPSSSPIDVKLVFELIVNDGRLNTLPDHVSVKVVPSSPMPNIASLSTVTASSQNVGDNQQAVKAVDGVADGFPNDYTKEWATLGEGAGAWIQLNWTSSYEVYRVVLYDRPNVVDMITGAMLTFSDGTSITVPALDNAGAGVEFNLGPYLTNSLRVTVLTVSGNTQNVGLSELEVYGIKPTGGNLPPVANAGPDQTVGQGVVVNLNGNGSSDPNGDHLSYQWTQTAGPSVSLAGANTATPSFTTPQGLTTTTKLTFSLIVNDGLLNSSSDTVDITVTSSSGSATNIARVASVTASSENISTNQQAIKAIDGVIDGMGTVTSDYTREWATVNGGAGSWIELNWSTGYQVNQVVLYDRPNTDDQITGATLTFSDGSTVSVGALNNTGAGVTVNFTPVITSRVRVTVTTVSGTTLNVGLAELEVYGVPATGGSNVVPVFVGGVNTLTVNSNSSAVSLISNLHVSDTDAGQTETWSQSVAPAHGTLVFSGATASSGSTDITPGGTITYQPAAGYTGSDSFTVQVSDGVAVTTRTFAVNVLANTANTAPTFVGGTTTLTVNSNSSAVSLIANLHVSDSDAGQTETWSQSTAPAHGTLVFSGATASSGSTNITPGGTITYQPTAGYSGSDSFTVQVSDGVAVTTRTFAVNVILNTAPTFVGGTTTLTVTRNSSAVSLKSNLHVSDTDAGQTETWTQSTAPAHGTLVFSGATASSGSTNITPGGTITYKPTTNYRGSDSFTVRVSDGVAIATRTFAVTVR